jgi:hypothetical protein
MKKHTFDSRIYAYVASLMEQHKTITKVFKELNDYATGTYYAYIPDNAPEEVIYDFESGIDAYVDNGSAYVNEVLEKAAIFLTDHLNSNAKAVCISSGSEEQRGNTWITHYDYSNPLIYYKKELYYLLKNSQNSLDESKKFIQSSAGFNPLQIIFLTYSEELKELKTRDFELSPQDLKALVQNCKKLLINTYDFRSYIFWEKA